MTGSPFVSAAWLDAALHSPCPPVVLDATLLLSRPRFDGDFRSSSGQPRWAEAHIPGSRHVAVDKDFSVPHATHDHHPPPQTLANRLAALGVSKADSVVAYDSVGGLWASRLWYLLDWIGIDARILDGGLTAWQAAGLPVVVGASEGSDGGRSGRGLLRRLGDAPAARWTVSTTRQAWVDKDELVRRLGLGTTPPAPASAEVCLVCGLAEAVFDGTEPTRYSRRGHIPGSKNVPARGLFDEHGLVLSPAEVRAQYIAAGVDLDREILLYCGGGISACANAAALAHAGLRRVRVYDGSLEEWSADPELPLLIGRA
ncbi:thiosulfate/3-mercaptopyruvate sulfurtransferase [Quadrisphaera granulorum]|uniref:Thiosulfate/3-mercaptopyruvate sulfurtransferase n=1 Tax=Quadrisphaera granulorum TaxID=317664 RepID=A0A315ZCI6_9ACTN|nr:rhodanese-like domain-containing protein [Quadrisphaera granulorum]PWJ42454.1 thiosulfate/3-mercaptopyruvate sulfurtransferase [Quadrisphaera granulorum]SZE99219.1 thiosulfate/3-mercaptopyruvate sulfurtransferase [Quadrisphaera granulorum]